MAKAQKAPGVERMLVNRNDWTITIWYDASVTDARGLEVAIAKAAEEVEASEEP